MKNVYSVFRIAIIFGVCIILLQGTKDVSATDGQPILELGIYSWVTFQQKKFFTDITEFPIKDNDIKDSKVTVSIYEPIFFENQDETNHRIVFIPDMNNDLEDAYMSPVIASGERWAIEIHNFGVFPFQCTLHPEIRGEITVEL